MTSKLDDMLHRAGAGDSAAFRQLHDAYDAFVLAKVRKVLAPSNEDAANDVAQEVWHDVHRQMQGYDPRIASFTRWLSVICIRRALNHERRERVRDRAVRAYQSHSRGASDAMSPNPASTIERSELIQAVRDCANLLIGREREIFAAVRLAASEVANVAIRYGISAGRVRGALCEANQKVLECLRGKGYA